MLFRQVGARESQVFTDAKPEPPSPSTGPVADLLSAFHRALEDNRASASVAPDAAPDARPGREASPLLFTARASPHNTSPGPQGADATAVVRPPLPFPAVPYYALLRRLRIELCDGDGGGAAEDPALRAASLTDGGAFDIASAEAARVGRAEFAAASAALRSQPVRRMLEDACSYHHFGPELDQRPPVAAPPTMQRSVSRHDAAAAPDLEGRRFAAALSDAYHRYLATCRGARTLSTGQPRSPHTVVLAPAPAPGSSPFAVPPPPSSLTAHGGVPVFHGLYVVCRGHPRWKSFVVLFFFEDGAGRVAVSAGASAFQALVSAHCGRHHVGVDWFDGIALLGPTSGADPVHLVYDLLLNLQDAALAPLSALDPAAAKGGLPPLFGPGAAPATQHPAAPHLTIAAPFPFRYAEWRPAGVRCMVDTVVDPLPADVVAPGTPGMTPPSSPQRPTPSSKRGRPPPIELPQEGGGGGAEKTGGGGAEKTGGGMTPPGTPDTETGLPAMRFPQWAQPRPLPLLRLVSVSIGGLGGNDGLLLPHALPAVVHILQDAVGLARYTLRPLALTDDAPSAAREGRSPSGMVRAISNADRELRRRQEPSVLLGLSRLSAERWLPAPPDGDGPAEAEFVPVVIQAGPAPCDPSAPPAQRGPTVEDDLGAAVGAARPSGGDRPRFAVVSAILREAAEDEAPADDAELA